MLTACRDWEMDDSSVPVNTVLAVQQSKSAKEVWQITSLRQSSHDLITGVGHCTDSHVTGLIDHTWIESKKGMSASQLTLSLNPDDAV